MLPAYVRSLAAGPDGTSRRVFASWDFEEWGKHSTWSDLGEWKLAEYLSLYFEMKLPPPRLHAKHDAEVLRVSADELIERSKLLELIAARKSAPALVQCRCPTCISLQHKAQTSDGRK